VKCCLLVSDAFIIMDRLVEGSPTKEARVNVSSLIGTAGVDKDSMQVRKVQRLLFKVARVYLGDLLFSSQSHSITVPQSLLD